MKRFLTFLLIFFTLIFVSCESTRVYVETHDMLYEDDILIQEEKSLTLDGKKKNQSVTNYYDLSGAGYVITDTTKTATKAHSVTATVTKNSGSSYVDVEYSVIETTLNTTTNRYTTSVVGTKTARLNKDGGFVAFDNGAIFKGDAMSDLDEDFLMQIAYITSGSMMSFGSSTDVNEGEGKSYRTEETIDEVTVVSVPNTQYIMYSILGKPFVLLGTGLWNLIKCLGYSFYNFAGGYNLSTGQISEEMPIWLMPSMSTAKEKFTAGKEANAIQYYPEYHLPFTDNTITVVTTEQMSNSTFVNDDNAVNVSRVAKDYTNEMSVARSAKADAEYTAGVVGLVGTGLTIPIAGLSWVAGFAGGIASKVAEAYH